MPTRTKVEYRTKVVKDTLVIDLFPGDERLLLQWTAWYWFDVEQKWLGSPGLLCFVSVINQTEAPLDVILRTYVASKDEVELLMRIDSTLTYIEAFWQALKDSSDGIWTSDVPAAPAVRWMPVDTLSQVPVDMPVLGMSGHDVLVPRGARVDLGIRFVYPDGSLSKLIVDREAEMGKLKDLAKSLGLTPEEAIEEVEDWAEQFKEWGREDEAKVLEEWEEKAKKELRRKK